MQTRATSDRDALIEGHRYLCRRAAPRFLRRGLDRGDLEQVAAIGLIKAADRYNAAGSTPFEAYAWIMIIGELMHHVRDFEHAVRLPRWLRRLEKRSAAIREELTNRLAREPTSAEIADALGVSLARLREVDRARNTMQTATRSLCGGRPEELAVRSPYSGGTHPEDRILAERALGVLGPVERSVVLGVYALELTQAEVARSLRLGTRQVQRMHRAALARMHGALA